MWIGKATQALIEHLRQSEVEWRVRFANELGENTRLKEENARLLSMNTWFQHRLTQVEMERGMMMQDRLGIKISVPAFVPAVDDPGAALNKLVDLSTIGLDAHESADTDADTTQNPGIDYTNLPGYKGKQ